MTHSTVCVSFETLSVNCERIKVFGTNLQSIPELHRVHETAQVGIVPKYPTRSENWWFNTDWNSCLVSKMFGLKGRDETQAHEQSDYINSGYSSNRTTTEDGLKYMGCLMGKNLILSDQDSAHTSLQW